MVTEARTSGFAIASGGHVFNLQIGRPLRVGRDPACEICLESAALSRMHAWFWLERGEVWIEDLGSRNGVFLNGQQITGRTLLNIGDDVLVGDRTLTLISSELERSDTQPTVIPSVTEIASATRNTEQSRTVYEVFMEAARIALGERRVAQAAKAVDQVLSSLESPDSARALDPRTLDTMTPVIVDLAIASQNALWAERLIGLRRVAERPLDPLAAAELARAIASLPSVDDRPRKGYVAWRETQLSDPGEKLALELLGNAHGRED